jgi:hypothetical protein
LAIVATIDHEMSILAGAVVPERLVASWATLVKLLALGPLPETRVCPVCAHVGMREAQRCGYCWTRLAPPGGGSARVTT